MRILAFLLLVATFATHLFADVRLPRLVSDGMVLQRDRELTIWGWAEPGEEVLVTFRDHDHRAVADEAGEWSVKLPPNAAGGPYDMRIAGENELLVRDILIGEVWVCSGQSNMELSMQRVSPLYGAEIAAADRPRIRYFEVPKEYDFQGPRADLSGGRWQAASPESVLSWSATAYFFALHLQDEYDVPVGLINSSLGGSPVEAWMSEEMLRDSFSIPYQAALAFKNERLVEAIENSDRRRARMWFQRVAEQDSAYQDTVFNWRVDREVYTAAPSLRIPGHWDTTAIGGEHGSFWLYRTIELPAAYGGQAADLLLGRIIDSDSAFVNGTYVGHTTYQYPPRRYRVPAGVLRAGANELVVRVVNEQGRGGFVPDKPYQLALPDTTIDLRGEWRIRRAARSAPLASQVFIRWKPMGLFNAMIAPLLNYQTRGVIWYQGESNADQPRAYRRLFPAMIRDWRRHWGQGDFPFLFVQLANFLPAKEQPGPSDWAMLREAQAMALRVPKTGMAVTIDIGEWNDIHPLNKRDVGRRLGLAAQRVAYGDTSTETSGPIYEGMKREGNTLVLSFQSKAGLSAPGGVLNGFAIAGADRRFVWANARIEGDKVVVWHPDIDEPVAVRYAWADNPAGANLYNNVGLPAAPFRTDDWER